MTAPPQHFIHKIIEKDLAAGRNAGKIVTRFPPEPNGYLHIGHAKAICLDFGLAREFGGVCHLRFDDTNPEKESSHYADEIQRDIRWLGFEWDALRHTSDYFEQLYEYALRLIDNGDAYVCELGADEIRKTRGTLTAPGSDSPWRARDKTESRDLFERMRAGEFAEGSRTLRAKIDMRSPNMNMRDPVLYRIRATRHQRSGDAWPIYPTYDYSHSLSDSLEGVTHSLCTLEFEDHRPLYDWFLEKLDVHRSRQYEFARLILKYTLTSKRKLKQLIDAGIVDGWNDPRMPTLSGMRRRGFPPAAIREFCGLIGLTKNDSVIELDLLESCTRDHLNAHAPRAFAVLAPLKVVIENFPEGKSETLRAPLHPKQPELGEREIPFSRVVYIDRDDFMENPPRKYFRLSPGKEVRLKYAYVIRCESVVKNKAGEITELRCVYDPDTARGKNPEGRKVKGNIHWVCADAAQPAVVRLYERLFLSENPGAEDDMLARLNPDSLVTMGKAFVEAGLPLDDGVTRQFERLGYFALDHVDDAGRPVFNRTLTLRDTWGKMQSAPGG